MTNTYYVAGIPFNSHDSLTHHGIKGQKWGIRRYQNPDGSLTEAGKKHYYGTKDIAVGQSFLTSRQSNRLNEVTEKEFKKAYKESARANRKYGEGRPDEIEAAYKTRARTEIANSDVLKEKKNDIYKAVKPEIDFENDPKLWKKFGYDPDSPDIRTIHDASNSYYDAKEKYMTSLGLKDGSDARKKYDENKRDAYNSYNSYVDLTVNSMLGHSGNIPVSVVSKWGNKYYSVAREAIARSLKYGYYAGAYSSNGVLDFYSLADDYAKEKR